MQNVYVLHNKYMYFYILSVKNGTFFKKTCQKGLIGQISFTVNVA